MHPQFVLAFLIVQSTLSIIPGPAVLKVVGTAMAVNRRQAVLVALGVLAGNGVYIALSIAGLGALLHAFPASLKAINVLGAAYIAWIAIGTIRSASQDAAPSRVLPAVPPGGNAFRLGLVAQLANPKSIVFFGALLPQFVTPGGWPPALQMAVLGLLSAVQELPVLVAYAVLADRLARRFRQGNALRWMQRCGGAMLLGAAGLVLRR